jgi:hopanoid C-3 methylase
MPTAVQVSRNLAHGQANFACMLWKFNKVYNAGRQYADHQHLVACELPLLPQTLPADRRQPYVRARPAMHQRR